MSYEYIQYVTTLLIYDHHYGQKIMFAININITYTLTLAQIWKTIVLTWKKRRLLQTLTTKTACWECFKKTKLINILTFYNIYMCDTSNKMMITRLYHTKCHSERGHQRQKPWTLCERQSKEQHWTDDNDNLGKLNAHKNDTFSGVTWIVSKRYLHNPHLLIADSNGREERQEKEWILN